MNPEDANESMRVRVVGAPERAGSIVSDTPREQDGTWSVKVLFDDGTRRMLRLAHLEPLPTHRDITNDIRIGQLATPISPPSGPAPRLLQGPPSKSKFLAAIETTLIIFDRDFDDIIVDPKRYRLANASLRLARFLRVFLPKPDITFILDIPPDICHARKPELTLEELERQRGILRKLAASGGRYVTIPAERAPEEVADKVGRGILKKLISRRRHSETNVV